MSWWLYRNSKGIFVSSIKSSWALNYFTFRELVSCSKRALQLVFLMILWVCELMQQNTKLQTYRFQSQSMIDSFWKHVQNPRLNWYMDPTFLPVTHLNVAVPIQEKQHLILLMQMLIVVFLWKKRKSPLIKFILKIIETCSTTLPFGIGKYSCKHYCFKTTLWN